jgi:hypothetical protein
MKTTKPPCCLCGQPRGKTHDAKNCKTTVLARAARLEFLARWNKKHAKA